MTSETEKEPNQQGKGKNKKYMTEEGILFPSVSKSSYGAITLFHRARQVNKGEGNEGVTGIACYMTLPGSL